MAHCVASVLFSVTVHVSYVSVVNSALLAWLVEEQPFLLVSWACVLCVVATVADGGVDIVVLIFWPCN